MREFMEEVGDIEEVRMQCSIIGSNFTIRHMHNLSNTYQKN